MKRIMLVLVMTGCSMPVPPQSVTTVTSTRVPVTQVRVMSEFVEVLEVEATEPPRSTWMTGAELQKVLDERHAKAVQAGQECHQGDPLCSILP